MDSPRLGVLRRGWGVGQRPSAPPPLPSPAPARSGPPAYIGFPITEVLPVYWVPRDRHDRPTQEGAAVKGTVEYRSPTGEDMPRKPLDSCKAARPPVHHPPSALVYHWFSSEVWGCSSFAHIGFTNSCTFWSHPRSWGALKLLATRKPDRHDDGFQHPTCLCCAFLRIQNVCFSFLIQERMFAIIYLVLPYSVGGWSF